jgi:hypothetical protein
MQKDIIINCDYWKGLLTFIAGFLVRKREFHLHPDKQPSDYTGKHGELENNPFLTRKQRTRRHKNKQRNPRQPKKKTNNSTSKKCPNIEEIGLMRLWLLGEKSKYKSSFF